MANARIRGPSVLTEGWTRKAGTPIRNGRSHLMNARIRRLSVPAEPHRRAEPACRRAPRTLGPVHAARRRVALGRSTTSRTSTAT